MEQLETEPLFINLTLEQPDDLVTGLADVAIECIDYLTSRAWGADSKAAPTVVIGRRFGASGRTADNLFAELAACGLKGLLRQSRFDKDLLEIPITLVDGPAAAVQELSGFAAILPATPDKFEITRSSGSDSGADWTPGSSL